MTATLAHRLKKHARDKARLSESEGALQELARKARNRRLYSAGGLVAKCGLLELEEATLYGALLTLEAGARDQKTTDRWKKAGEVAQAHDEAEKQKVRVPLMIVYPGPVPPLTKAELKKAGVNWNKRAGLWIGAAVPAEAQALAEAHSGRVEMLPTAPAVEATEEDRQLAAE